MRIRFLGTGAAFTLDNFHSNMVIEEEGKRLLIDAGGDIRFSLKNVGLSYKDIDCIYVTHLHNDHIGGMEFLAFSSYFDPACHRIKLYCHKWLVDDLWSFSLKGGLASIQGQILNLDDYFDVHGLGNGEFFTWQNVTFEIVQTTHVYNGYWVVPTFGVFFESPATGQKIYHTSDTQLDLDTLRPYYQRADIIIHDCETSVFQTDIHSHYDALRLLGTEYKAKMYLWHYQDNVFRDLDTWDAKAKADGFQGFLKRGQEMEM